MQANQLIQTLRTACLAHYDEREATRIAQLTAAHLVGLDNHIAPLLVDPVRRWPIETTALNEVIERLQAGEPMQYIIGHTDFYGRDFKVDSRVLIPRPETEELVHRIYHDNPSAHRILDVGTGCGCIAITLKLELPESEVTAVDLSTDALTVARENAERLGAEVDFRQADALHGLAEAFDHSFDLIVSNPPYVPDSDRQTMHCNVLDHEPSLALFVPDEDPLRFYRAIAEAGQTLLDEGGMLYFEIYHALADEMKALVEGLGYEEVKIIHDLYDKPRMLCGRKATR